MNDFTCCVGVLGAGQMGRGIAQVAAQAGHEVFLCDINGEILKKGHDFILAQWQKGLSKGKFSQELITAWQSTLKPVESLEELKGCDFVIEAVSENPELKYKIFQELDQKMHERAILASNTSSISITEIAARTGRPEKVAGMHFMNPVPVMKLVEGIRGLETSDETFGQVEKLALSLGKTFIKANDRSGFAVNRVLMPMINEAIYAHYEGVASLKDIDESMKLGCNFPMGPFELADFIGLDTCLAIMEVLHDGLGDTKYRPCPLLKQYVAAGRLGRKSNRGFYEY